MPQPLSKVRSNANVSLHLEHSTNNAELAVLVTGIFARWAWIEHQLSILLLHILDAEAKPALAMLSELKTQKLQMSAMRAAAKAVLSPELFETFAAVMFAVDCVQNDRNRLAHWVWGTSPELPDRLLLVNPESLKATEVRFQERHWKMRAQVETLEKRTRRIGKDASTSEFAEVLLELGRGLALVGGNEDFDELSKLDPSQIFVYSRLDLERTQRDLGQVVGMLVMLRTYLKPLFPDDAAPKNLRLVTRKQALEYISRQRLFQEALARARKEGGGHKA
jgi:hypothetical protein